MVSTYPTSWEIHPDKQPDLTYDATVNDENYLEGYEQAQFERICHTPNQPDIREIGGQINHGN